MKLALLVALLSTAAWAHTLTESTARVTLRDGHVDVLADVDLFLLVGTDPTSLAVATEAELGALLAQLRQTLEDQTRLSVDGAPVTLVLHGLPSASQLRVVAAVLSASGHQHGELVRVSFDAAAATPGAQRVSLSMPPALGPTLVSFIQPVARYTPPGAAASFKVERAEPSPATRHPWRTGTLILGAALLALALGTRRRTR